MSNEKDQSQNRIIGFMSTSGWLIILGAVLSMSSYSLFFVGRHIGVPTPFALIGSACFDGVALLSATYSLRYAELGMIGTGPRMAVFAFGALSATLNAFHAVIGHEPYFAIAWWIGPPIAAVVVLEFHLRWTRRIALMTHGLIAKSYRPLGRRVWVDHPFEAFRTRRAISAERLRQVTEEEAPTYVAKIESERMAREAEAMQLSSQLAAIESEESRERSEAEDIRKALDRATSQAERVRVALRYAPEGPAKSYVEWLSERGIDGVTAVYIRQIRASEKRRETEENRRGIRAV